jgi:hypothetical protein
MLIIGEFLIPMEAAVQLMEMQDTAYRVGTCFANIREYLANADDLTLAYLGIREKQRDLFLEHELELYTSKNPMEIGVPTAKEEPVIKVGFNPCLSRTDDDTLQRMAAHEVGHFFPQKSENVITRFCASRFARKTDIVTRSFPIASFAATSTILVLNGMNPLEAYACTAGMAVLKSYPQRRNERFCDDFADRLIPEVNHFSALSQLLNDTGNVQAIPSILQPYKGPKDYISNHLNEYSAA